jgi:hypothetical protein
LPVPPGIEVLRRSIRRSYDPRFSSVLDYSKIHDYLRSGLKATSERDGAAVGGGKKIMTPCFRADPSRMVQRVSIWGLGSPLHGHYWCDLPPRESQPCPGPVLHMQTLLYLTLCAFLCSLMANRAGYKSPDSSVKPFGTFQDCQVPVPVVAPS